MDQKKECPEFPFFGATYPDARCIDGYLWDLDSCGDGGLLYNGGHEPCPFCNSKHYIEHADPDDRDEIIKEIESLHKKYGYA